MGRRIKIVTELVVRVMETIMVIKTFKVKKIV